MNKSFSISRLEKSEIDALFVFRKKAFPVNSKQMDMARWRWLYLDNPEINDLIPVWILKSEGEIVGTIGTIPTRVKVGVDFCMTSFGTDYYVTEEFHGLPSLRLLKTMLAASALNIGANLSVSAQRLFSKLGYVDLSANLVKVSTSLPSARPGPKKLKNQLKHFVKQAIRKIACPVAYDVEVFSNIPDSYQSLWEDIEPSLEVSVVKDVKYLRWRYEACPSADYKFILLKKGGKIRSIAVVLVPDQGQVNQKHGIVLELLARTGDYFAAFGGIKACMDYFDTQGCDACFSHLSDSWASRCFSLMAFSRSPSDLGLMVLTSRKDYSLNRAQHARAWTFSLGDTDRF